MTSVHPRTARNNERFGTLEERADLVYAFLRGRDGFVPTATINAAHEYPAGMLGGVLAKLKDQGRAERRGRTWRARRPAGRAHG